MPSVEQRFNKNPPKPRLLIYNENELVKRREKYIIESDGYYKDRGVLSLLASTQLKKILERRVSPFGDSLSTTGLTKQLLIEKIRDVDLSIVSKIFYSNSTTKEFYSTKIMDFSSTDEENNAIISTNNLNQTVTLLLLKQLRVGMPLQADLVSIIFGMLQTRDEKIFEVHKNRHENNDHYK
jgi:hypothetical protein